MPRLRAGDRAFWVVLRKLWSGWDRSLIIVRPETVIAWHRQGFRLFWRRRSIARQGRPSPDSPRTHRLHPTHLRRPSRVGRGQDRRGVRRQVRDPPFREHDPALHGPAHRWPPQDPDLAHLHSATTPRRSGPVTSSPSTPPSSPSPTSSSSWRSARGGSSTSTSRPTRRCPG